jgi:hypothetical protein
MVGQERDAACGCTDEQPAEPPQKKQKTESQREKDRIHSRGKHSRRADRRPETKYAHHLGFLNEASLTSVEDFSVEDADTTVPGYIGKNTKLTKVPEYMAGLLALESEGFKILPSAPNEKGRYVSELSRIFLHAQITLLRAECVVCDRNGLIFAVKSSLPLYMLPHLEGVERACEVLTSEFKGCSKAGIRRRGNFNAAHMGYSSGGGQVVRSEVRLESLSLTQPPIF